MEITVIQSGFPWRQRTPWGYRVYSGGKEVQNIKCSATPEDAFRKALKRAIKMVGEEWVYKRKEDGRMDQ